MHINFDLTPEENVRALVLAENPDARMDDILVGEATELSDDPSARNTSVTLTGNGTGVYGVQTLDVKYNRRAVSDTEVTTGVITVEVPFDGDSEEEIIAAVVAACVTPGVESYLSSHYNMELNTVVLSPSEAGVLCLDGEVSVAITVAEESAVLGDDITVTELDGFGPPV